MPAVSAIISIISCTRSAGSLPSRDPSSKSIYRLRPERFFFLRGGRGGGVEEPLCEPLLEPPLAFAVAGRFVVVVDWAGAAVFVAAWRPPLERLVSASACAWASRSRMRAPRPPPEPPPPPLGRPDAGFTAPPPPSPSVLPPPATATVGPM